MGGLVGSSLPGLAGGQKKAWTAFGRMKAIPVPRNEMFGLYFKRQQLLRTSETKRQLIAAPGKRLPG
jgi:hypothetical protein